MKSLLKLGFYFGIKLIGGFHLSRWLTRRKLRILCYHGLSHGDQHLFEDILFIQLKTFERRINLIHRWKMNVIPLDQAVSQLPNNQLPDHSTVITFDDGWHSTTLALPALKKYRYPSTLYAATYYSLVPTEVFNVLIRYLFWKTSETSIELCNLGDELDGTHSFTNTDEKNRLQEKFIQLGDKGDVKLKEKLAYELAKVLKIDLDIIKKERWFQYLTIEELRELKSGGMSLELHTHRHRFPPEPETEVLEIKDNRSVLNQVRKADYDHFCFPSGDFSKEQIPRMKAMGLKSATTTINHMNEPQTEIFLLGRFLDRDTLSDLEFEANLCGFREVLSLLSLNSK